MIRPAQQMWRVTRSDTPLIPVGSYFGVQKCQGPDNSVWIRFIPIRGFGEFREVWKPLLARYEGRMASGQLFHNGLHTYKIEFSGQRIQGAVVPHEPGRGTPGEWEGEEEGQD